MTDQEPANAELWPCPRCQAQIPSTSTFCPNCGLQLTTAAAPAAAATPEPQRKTGWRAWGTGKKILVFGGIVLLVLVALSVALLRAGSPGAPASTPVAPGWPAPDYVSQYGGSQQVYDDIAASTDCAELQATFNRADANNQGAEPGSAEKRWTLGYMTAADERMKAVGCYD